jgi:hypothetical protein
MSRQKNGDPRLKTRSWQAIVAHFQRQQPTHCEATPCLLPGIPITYTPTRTRTSLDVGHKIPRAIDTRLTWTIADCRPEHAACSRSHGARVKAQIKRIRTITAIRKEEQARSANKW